MFRAVVRALAITVASGLFAVSQAAPNLVPNPSFETVNPCPSMIDLDTGEIHFATPWSRARSTPDLFHHCGATNSVKTPSNAMGTQCPYGVVCGSTPPGGYAGIVAYQSSTSNAREMIQAPLISSLVAGKKYRVRFYVSLADFFQYGIDRMGAHVRTGAVDPNNPPVMAAQVQNPAGTLLTDKLGWTMITGKFTAAGGENQIVLGNFSTDINTMKQNTGSGSFTQAYYYVDMVSLRRADITDITILPPGGGGDIWQAQLTSGAPDSPARLYCSNTLTGSEVDSVELDLGGTPLELATATTDASGNATFRWSLTAALACADALGRFHLEARVDDPASGESSDSDEETVDTTPTDAQSGVRTGARLGALVATPNPFNPTTRLSYELHGDGPARVELFDAAGRAVRVLQDRAWQVEGRYVLLWNGADDRGRALGAGVYYYRVTSGDATRSTSIVLVK